MNTNFTYERYQRQIFLKELGIAGQHKLAAAKVLVIGAGGLGCAALQYLVAAGIGNVGIVDDDVVSISNLHRQVIYTVQDFGKPKSLIAKEKLQQLNPEISIIAYNEKLTTKNALNIIECFEELHRQKAAVQSQLRNYIPVAQAQAAQTVAQIRAHLETERGAHP